MSFASDVVYGCGCADSDTDDRNSPNVFQLLAFLSGNGCADTDTETWNSVVVVFYILVYIKVIQDVGQSLIVQKGLYNMLEMVKHSTRPLPFPNASCCRIAVEMLGT